MVLYEISIRPDQRAAASGMNLPVWHSRVPPKHLPQPTVYARTPAAIYTTDKKTYKSLSTKFHDDIEFIKGVVYSPKSEKEDATKPKDKADEPWQICGKKYRKTFM